MRREALYNEGIVQDVKNSAMIRFLAKIGNILKPEDIKAEHERFTADNLSADSHSGMIIYDNKFAELKQVDSKPPFVANTAQMQQINENVFRYFGTSGKILQNAYTEDEWNAYYESKIEPFAIQLSLVLTNMLFTDRQMAHRNEIIITSNRLQYASNQTKLQISSQLFDRGILSTNDVMDIWNVAHVPDGDHRWICKEYARADHFGGGIG